MTTTKNIGIWMDHAVAHVMELKNDEIITQNITSDFTHQEKEYSLSKNENLMHNKEQHQQAKYYNAIKDATKNHESIVLFGPTTAKNELLNLMKADHHFENIKVESVQADKMTENQQHAFVKNHFKTQL
jgi:stalled ribosome rescue protein Dom34